MSELIENYSAKNFKLDIIGNLHALNHGLDFAGVLNSEEAMGARILTESIKMLDDMNVEDWEIYGWFGDQWFGEDFNGEMEDGTSFFNEAYFENEMKMNELWMKIPCMKITVGETFSGDGKHVFIGMIMAPYMRTTIMEPRMISCYLLHLQVG